MKRWLSMVLTVVLCFSFLPQCASAEAVDTENVLSDRVGYLLSERQAVSTEELLEILAACLIDGASSGLEVEVRGSDGTGGKVVYSPDGENGAAVEIVTPEGRIALDAAGLYVEQDGQTAGVAMDELMSFLLESTLGISHLPRFSAHDGVMMIGLLDTLWNNILQEAVHFETDGAGSAVLEIDVDRLAASVDSTLARLLEEYAAEVDDLLSEYGVFLENFVHGFPKNLGELKGLLDALNLKSVQTGMTVSLTAMWDEDSWQADGAVFGWNVRAAWEDGEFTAEVSPSEMLPDGLPTYTLDSRDLDRLMLLVYGLLETVPSDALSFSADSLLGGQYSFRIDTERLIGHIYQRVPSYLEAYEVEIGALVEKYMPFLKLLSPQAEQWGNAEWLAYQMRGLARILPRNFRAEGVMKYSWLTGSWQLDVTVNEAVLSASVGYGNVTAFLSVLDDSGVYAYTLDARLTENGAEMVCGMTENGRTQQLTVCLTENSDGYLVEAYTRKDRFYAVLHLKEEGAQLEILEDGQRVAEGSVKVAGRYVYIDWISDGLTLDGTLIVGNGAYVLNLLVNGLPVTAKLELPIYRNGTLFELHADGMDLEAEFGRYGVRLYADLRGIMYTRKQNVFLLEFLPLQNKYSFIIKDCIMNSSGVLSNLLEYGFEYVPGRLSIMNRQQTVTVSDVTSWTDGCLNATDVTVFHSRTGYNRSIRIITRAEDSNVLIAEVYVEDSDEAALTVTIRRNPERLNLPRPDRWMSAEEVLGMIGN